MMLNLVNSFKISVIFKIFLKLLKAHDFINSEHKTQLLLFHLIEVQLTYYLKQCTITGFLLSNNGSTTETLFHIMKVR